MGIFKQLYCLLSDNSYEEAIGLFNCREYDKAIEMFNCALNSISISRINRNLAKFYSSQAYRNLGIIQFAKGDFRNALANFRNALKLNSAHSDLFYFIGICCNNLNMFKEAIEAFNVLLKIDPDNIPTKIKMAMTFHNLKMWDIAEEINRAVLEKKPNYADVNFRLGLALVGQGKVNEASIYFENSLKINPKYINAQIKLGFTKVYLGYIDEAINLLTPIAEKFLEYSDINYILGILWTKKNNVEYAVKYFENSLKVNPKYKNPIIRLIILYCRAGQIDCALNKLEEANSIFIDDNRFMTALALIKKVIDNPDESKENILKHLDSLFDEAEPLKNLISEVDHYLDITPNFSEMMSIIDINELAEKDLSLSQSIIPLIEDYICRNPNYPDLYNSIGIQYLKLNRFNDAEKAFREAVRLNPSYLNARINLFKSLQQLGKNSEALEHGLYIISKNLPYPDVHCTMAEVYFSFKKFDQALFYAKKALEIRPSYLIAHKLIERITSISY